MRTVVRDRGRLHRGAGRFTMNQSKLNRASVISYTCTWKNQCLGKWCKHERCWQLLEPVVVEF